ncbi:MAG: nucleotidyltransferase [Moraxellaceae bacterium]|nr:MAG: nucleotidyltransferase [Moraxellaceae bacterium]
MHEDTRWQQRLSNYKQALLNLTEAVNISQRRPLSNLEQQGLIQAFEFTHELAWNCLKDYLQYQGEQNLLGSRDATRKAFSVGLITDGEQWMDMIASRNRTSHTYNKETAQQIVEAVLTHYYPLFKKLEQRLTQLKETPNE